MPCKEVLNQRVEGTEDNALGPATELDKVFCRPPTELSRQAYFPSDKSLGYHLLSQPRFDPQPSFSFEIAEGGKFSQETQNYLQC